LDVSKKALEATELGAPNRAPNLLETDLLGAAKARGFFSTRPHTLTGAWDSLPPSGSLEANAAVGPYRLKSKLGEGGMGVVWLAQQTEPFQREVAIKLLSQRLQGGLARAYFQVERQALAQMQHPYIAQIYDAGTLPDGALFFAMEYVQGVTLDYFAERQARSLKEIVDLLIKVCQGVHYAHQRGLIHRDLKPSNVLVIEVGGQMLPKIIDFGVAVGVNSNTMSHVDSRDAVGTFAYMAPEQAEPGPAGIDARVDVYALGAMLGECLCLKLGIQPDAPESTARSLRAGVIQSLGRHDRDGLLSSARLSTELKKIPHDLRAILLKATVTERRDRYDSASALADDLERYRLHFPVRACAPQRLYTLRCFVRRNRLATVAGSLIGLALVIGLIVATYGLREARAARSVAENRRESAEALIGYMLGDFADRLRPLGRLDLLDGVSSQAMKYLGAPDAIGASPVSALRRASALRTLGEVHAERNQMDAARAAFSEADSLLAAIPAAAVSAEIVLERGTTAYWIGNLHFQAHQLDQAEVHWQRYLAFSQVLAQSDSLAAKGRLEVAYAHGNLAALEVERRDFEQAVVLVNRSISGFRALFDAAPNDPEVSAQLSNQLSWLGRIYEAKGDLRAAKKAYERQLELIAAVRKADPNAALWRSQEGLARQWIGMMSASLGEGERAQAEFEKAHAAAALVTEHDPTNKEWVRDLAFCDLQLAQFALDAGRLAEARRRLSTAQAKASSLLLGTDTPPSWTRLHTRIQQVQAELLRLEGEPQKALRLLAASTAALTALHQKDPADHHSRLALARSMLAEASLNPNGSPKLTEIDALLKPVADFNDPTTLETLARLALQTRQPERYAQALSKLNAMHFQEANFRAFIAANQGTTQ